MSGSRAILAAACALGLLLALAPTADAAAPLTWGHPYSVDDPNNGVEALSCPSTRLCVAVDDSGEILVTKHPTATGRWKLFNVEVHPTSAAHWGLSCPSAHLCVAVGGVNILWSTDPLGGVQAWHVTRHVLSSGRFLSVSCPALSLCIAGGATNTYTHGVEVTSTEPTKAVSHWQGANLANTNAINGVSCPTTHFCAAAGGNVFYSEAPQSGIHSWRETTLQQGSVHGNAFKIACPTATLCLAADLDGNLWTSTNPAAGSWRVAPIDHGSEPQVVSCPTTTLCVIGDNRGHLISTTHPLLGSSAWAVARPDGNGNFDGWFSGLACPSTKMCIAMDTHGNAVVGTRPGP